MAQYAIMRCVKLKSLGNVSSSLKHNFREIETHNADKQRTHENEHLTEVDSSAQAMGKLRERLPEKRRKDAVTCVEYLFSASPEWWLEASAAQKREFVSESMEWLNDKYGSENIVAATLQVDETTPHISAFVVPITQDGRLCAKDFIGGREKLSNDQTSYASKVAGIGLERGVKNSKSKHQSIRKYYSNVNESEGLSSQLESPLSATNKVIESLPNELPQMPLFTSKIDVINEVRDRDNQAWYEAIQGLQSHSGRLISSLVSKNAKLETEIKKNGDRSKKSIENEKLLGEAQKNIVEKERDLEAREERLERSIKLKEGLSAGDLHAVDRHRHQVYMAEAERQIKQREFDAKVNESKDLLAARKAKREKERDDFER